MRRPTLAGIVIVSLSTLFWLTQNNTNLEKAFERSIADFLPLLPLGSKIEVGLMDYVIKIIGGAITFGLLAIALRRRFERRFRH